MKLRYIAALAVLGLAAAAVAGVGRPDNAQSKAAPTKGAITVTATGTITKAPDQAEVDLGVVTHSDQAKEALSENSDSASKIIDALKSAGIADKNIRTDQVGLSPTYSDSGDTITGYTANNDVHVKVAIADAGKLIDSAAAAGANNVSGPTLSVSDHDALYNDALKNAVTAARAKAEAIASASGVQVGAVTNVTENTDQSNPMYEAAPMAAASAKSTPIEAGTQDIQASVTVSFAIG